MQQLTLNTVIVQDASIGWYQSFTFKQHILHLICVNAAVHFQFILWRTFMLIMHVCNL